MKPIIFSIVTPSFNQGEFIEDTIKSVLTQQGDFYIEYILMDGGSTDSSVEIIKKYERLLKAGDWPVRCAGIEYCWTSGRDNGQADAIEKGFLKAHGNIGAWLNSDDTFYSDRVFDVVSGYFKDSELEMLVGDGIIIDRAGRKTADYRTERIDMKELVFLDYHILQPSVFLSMSIYKKNSFDTSLNYTFDVEFFIRLLRAGVRYKKTHDVFSCFRVYPEIKTMTGGLKSVKEYMSIARKATDSRALLCVTYVYKYLSVALRPRCAGSKLFEYPFLVVRSVFYRVLVGNWGLR